MAPGNQGAYDALRAAQEARCRTIVDSALDWVAGDEERGKSLVYEVISALEAALTEQAAAVTLARKSGHVSLSKELAAAATRVHGYADDIRVLEFDEPGPKVPKYDAHGILISDESTAATLHDAGAALVNAVQEDIQRQADQAIGAALNEPAKAGLPSERLTAVVDYLAGLTDVNPISATPVPDIKIEEEETPAVQLDPSQFAGLDDDADVVEPVAQLDGDQFGGMRLPERPPARKVTYADLLSPASIPLPDHTSVSRIQAYAECGMRTYITRRAGIAEVPAWWNVGGDTFHAIIEDLERVAAEHGWKSDTVAGVIIEINDSDSMVWEREFKSQILKTETETGITREFWRAAKKNTEHYTWWMAEGPDMLRRYIAARDPSRQIFRFPDGQPGIEWAYSLPIPGLTVPLNGIIDQVWTPAQGAAGTIEIDDLKAGASMPDTWQLGVYGWAVRHALGVPPDAVYPRVLARHYKARTAEFTEQIDVLKRHPWDDVVYRATMEWRAESNGIYLPVTGGIGGGQCTRCGVRQSCPAGGAS